MFYCYSCANKSGYLSDISTNNIKESSYQLDKFIKHTTPQNIHPINSIFKPLSTQQYDNYIVNALHAGCVEIDEFNRKNLIYYAGKKVGATYINNAFQFDTDTIKVVLSTDENRIHCFTISSTEYDLAKCLISGKLILK